MRHLFAIAATLGLFSISRADLFVGTIEVTITEARLVNNPPNARSDAQFAFNPVGTVFGGWYSYASDSIDGTFEGFYGTLKGELLLSDTFQYGPSSLLRLDRPWEPSVLIVTNGVVAGLGIADSGTIDLGFDPKFHAFDNLSHVFWAGTVVVTDPQRVPDAGNSLSLLVISLAGLAMIRRRLVR